MDERSDQLQLRTRLGVFATETGDELAKTHQKIDGLITFQTDQQNTETRQ